MPLSQWWQDEVLRWNPDNYHGIKAVRVYADRLWKPDLSLYNQYVYDFILLLITVIQAKKTVWVHKYTCKCCLQDELNT